MVPGEDQLGEAGEAPEGPVHAGELVVGEVQDLQVGDVLEDARRQGGQEVGAEFRWLRLGRLLKEPGENRPALLAFAFAVSLVYFCRFVLCVVLCCVVLRCVALRCVALRCVVVWCDVVRCGVVWW